MLVQAAGVCRDYAHLGIAFCRALGVPARYVSGYAVDLRPPDFHGFFEAYLEGRSGNVEELRSALQAAQYVPSAAIQAEAKAQLQQLHDIERIDAANPQQSDP